MESRFDSLAAVILRNRRLEIARGTIRVVREIPDRDRWVVAAEYEGFGPLDAAPARRRMRTYQGLFSLRPTEFRWHLAGSSIGAVGASSDRSQVWSRFGGFTSTGFGSVRGGWVADASGRVVRLTDGASRAVEGDVVDGVAILAWPDDGSFGPTIVRTELLDAAGGVIRTDVSAARS